MGVKIKKLFSLLILLLLLALYLPSVIAEEYYADLNIEVDSSGFVTIDGTTNHPDLLVENTEIYTSKKQSYWLLNITKEDIFSDFVYVVTLPESSSINYLKSSGSIRIEEEQGDLLVKGFGENKTFSVVVQYQIEKTSDDVITSQINESLLILIVVLIIALVILFVYFYRSKIFKKPAEVSTNKEEYNLKGLSERQKEIMKLLIERKRPLTQTDIQRELEMPKAAVSRNIRTLEQKGLIEKEQIGMSNLITLKKQ